MGLQEGSRVCRVPHYLLMKPSPGSVLWAWGSKEPVWEMPAQEPSAGPPNRCFTSWKLPELSLSPGPAPPETENGQRQCCPVSRPEMIRPFSSQLLYSGNSGVFLFGAESLGAGHRVHVPCSKLHWSSLSCNCIPRGQDLFLPSFPLPSRGASRQPRQRALNQGVRRHLAT